MTYLFVVFQFGLYCLDALFDDSAMVEVNMS